ncbi:YitT family protein [Arcobacter roscoffensis]|uniref:YitT family protein n=1 Tax=Arcobacter roscoffensis TaxID=2961520 RepID=A0ABY5DZZ2_9BACT|nr:YitT family protein [Arcobacter roscoffensis]UTJ05524.1 YitT family protein [Arcobacter roscoffensis]
MSKLLKNEELKNYLLITFASIILALGVVGFFTPNMIITGGTAGLSLLLYYITDLSIGTLIVAVNIPLLIVGWKYLGKMFAIKTVFTIAIISLLIDFFDKVLNIQAFVKDPFLGSIFGGIFIGIGLALVIKANASAGGSTIVAKIVASKSEIKPSTVIMVIDSFIILSSLFIFDDTARVLYSIVSIYVSSKIIDTILTGRLNKKVVYLVTNETELLRKLIAKQLGPEGTIIKGDGLYQDQEKKMILLVVEVGKLQVLRQIVKQNDPDGFLIITEATEMLGRGH